MRAVISLARAAISLMRAAISLVRAVISVVRATISLMRAVISLMRAAISLVCAAISLVRAAISLARAGRWGGISESSAVLSDTHELIKTHSQCVEVRCGAMTLGEGRRPLFLGMKGGFMPSTFPPYREADLVTWTQSFSSQISATPTAFGLTAAMATTYATLSTAFVSAYNTANAEATRTRVTVNLKDVAKAAMIANARSLIRTIQGTASVTPAQKLALGINPRDVMPAPIPAPANPPVLVIKSAVNRTVRVRLQDATNPERRGRPPGVAGCTVFSYVGATAPSDPSQYHFEGSTSKTLFDVTFPDDVANGAQIWITAFWKNAKDQSGPACAPVGANLPGGAAMPGAA